MNKDFESYLSKILANKDNYVGYSEDNRLLIISDDLEIVTMVVREYNKKHKVKTTFGYPTFRTYGKPSDILVRNIRREDR